MELTYELFNSTIAANLHNEKFIWDINDHMNAVIDFEAEAEAEAGLTNEEINAKYFSENYDAINDIFKNHSLL